MSTTIALGQQPSTTNWRARPPARLLSPALFWETFGKSWCHCESWGRGKAKADLGLGVGEIWTSTQENLQGELAGGERV